MPAEFHLYLPQMRMAMDAIALRAVADQLAVRRESLAGKPLGLRPVAR